MPEMSGSIGSFPDAIAWSVIDAGQRLAAWRAGRHINALRWALGQAWVLHDAAYADEARRLATELPHDILQLRVGPTASERLMSLADAIGRDWGHGFASLDHAEQISDARHELRRLDRLGERPLDVLQQEQCRSLVRTATHLVDELTNDLAVHIPGPIWWILRLAIHVDQALRPAGEVAEMFQWQRDDEHSFDPRPAPVSAAEYFRPHGQPRRVTPEPLPELCSGPSRPCEAVLRADWLRALRSRWSQSPIPIQWCPVSEECLSGDQCFDRGSLVELLEAVATASLSRTDLIPISWDRNAGKLCVGPLLVRSVIRKAVRIRALFDDFEKAEWRTSIPRPPDPKLVDKNGRTMPWSDTTWNEVSQSLKSKPGTRYIEFFGRNGRIGWRWQPVRAASRRPPRRTRRTP